MSICAMPTALKSGGYCCYRYAMPTALLLSLCNAYGIVCYRYAMPTALLLPICNAYGIIAADMQCLWHCLLPICNTYGIEIWRILLLPICNAYGIVNFFFGIIGNDFFMDSHIWILISGILISPPRARRAQSVEINFIKDNYFYSICNTYGIEIWRILLLPICNAYGIVNFFFGIIGNDFFMDSHIWILISGILISPPRARRAQSVEINFIKDNYFYSICNTYGIEI